MISGCSVIAMILFLNTNLVKLSATTTKKYMNNSIWLNVVVLVLPLVNITHKNRKKIIIKVHLINDKSEMIRYVKWTYTLDGNDKAFKLALYH